MKKIPEDRAQILSDHLMAIRPRKLWLDIAKKTNVPWSTLKKIAYRERKNPGIRTVDALYNYLINK
jgi:hypothetical protein